MHANKKDGFGLKSAFQERQTNLLPLSAEYAEKAENLSNEKSNYNSIPKLSDQEKHQFRQHSIGIGSTILFSEIFPDADIAYLSLMHKYLFNK